MHGERSSIPTTFHRPENSPPPPPPSPSSPSRSEKLGWLSGVLSGAGKFISSVFGSNSSDSYSSAGSSEEGIVGSFDGEGDAAHSLKEHDMQIEKSKFGNDWLGAKKGSLSIVSEIEPKCAIEQLVLQEIFTRAEGNRLTKIIQSRIVDDQSADCKQSDMQLRTFSEVIASPGSIQCLDQFRVLPDCIHHSSSRLNALSPLSSACLPADSSSPFGLGHNLNRDITRFNLQSEFDCPVKVAKSYMMSLPCSQFQSGHQATPSSAMHLHTDKETHGSSPCFLSSKFRKRNYTSILGDTFNDDRRVRFRSTESLSNISKVTQDKTSSDDPAAGIFNQSDEKTLRGCNIVPANDISEAIATENTMSADHGSTLIPLSLRVSDPGTTTLVERDVRKKQFSKGVKDDERPLENKEQLEKVPVPVVTQRNGIHQQDIIYSEQKMLADKSSNCAPSTSAGLKAKSVH